jgi:hypothetical protein
MAARESFRMIFFIFSQARGIILPQFAAEESMLARLWLPSAIAIALIGTMMPACAEPTGVPASTEPAADQISPALPASQPSDSQAADPYAVAKAKRQALEQACLARLRATDQYQSAMLDLEQAKKDRIAAAGEDIPAAAQRLMQASSAVHRLEQDALDQDPTIAAAKHEMIAAAKAAGGPAKAVLPPINRAVLEFAEQSLGKTIGDGQCWTLGAEALKAARAKPPGPTDVYVFGRQLGPDESALPGDIMQFTSCRFEGSWGWLLLGTPNHTAVIQQVESKTVYDILGQNPGPVAARKIDFQYLKSGSYKIYRPLPRY